MKYVKSCEVRNCVPQFIKSPDMGVAGPPHNILYGIAIKEIGTIIPYTVGCKTKLIIETTPILQSLHV